MGDGAVGTAVAVALSSKYKTVLLAGPPGITPTKRLFSVKGLFNLEAEIEHIPINSIPDSVNIIILAVKAFHIQSVTEVLSKLNYDRFISLSNGIGFEHYLKDFMAEYAVLSMGFNKLSQTLIETSSGSVYCEHDSSTSDIFKNSSIPITWVPDISEYRWSKWFANSIINPIAALTGLANNQLLERGLKELIDELSIELVKLLPSQNAVVNGKDLLNWLLINSTNRCSMLQDFEGKKLTEIDYLTGLALRILPGSCPVASNLVTLIKAQEINKNK